MSTTGPPADRPRSFVVDSMLGKMAKWLRILGFDTVCQRLETLADLERHRAEGRLIVTRNTRWRNRPGVVFLTENELSSQLRRLIREAAIEAEDVVLLARCIRCNSPLERVRKTRAVERVPDYVFATADVFLRCPDCARLYWRGSHTDRMLDQLQRMTGWVIETVTQRRT